MKKHDFGRTYDYIYKVASSHSVPSCEAVMDAAVRIYLDEKDRYYKEQEMERKARRDPPAIKKEVNDGQEQN